MANAVMGRTHAARHRVGNAKSLAVTKSAPGDTANEASGATLSAQLWVRLNCADDRSSVARCIRSAILGIATEAVRRHVGDRIAEIPLA